MDNEFSFSNTTLSVKLTTKIMLIFYHELAFKNYKQVI